MLPESTKRKEVLKMKYVSQLTRQQKIARHVSFRYIRTMKEFNQLGIAHQVIIEMWLKNMITFNTKHNLIKWLYT